MKNFRRELHITTIFAAIFLATSFVMPSAIINQSSSIEHSFRIISLSYESLGTLMDCETGYRGYMLTRNVSFLEPQVECICHIQDQLAKLQLLVADNPKEKQLLPLMIDVAARKMKLAQEAVDSPPSNESGRIVLLSKGKELMDQFRTHTGNLIAVENEVLESRRLGMHDLRNFVYVSQFILSTIVLGFLVHLCFRLRSFKEVE